MKKIYCIKCSNYRKRCSSNDEKPFKEEESIEISMNIYSFQRNIWLKKIYGSES